MVTVVCQLALPGKLGYERSQRGFHRLTLLCFSLVTAFLLLAALAAHAEGHLSSSAFSDCGRRDLERRGYLDYIINFRAYHRDHGTPSLIWLLA